MNEASTLPHVQVIDRAMALLAVLADEPRGAVLGDLAKRTGLAKPTARRVLASLEQHRFCERTPDGRYELGLGAFELGMRLYNRLDLRVRGRAALEALSESTGLTVYLCVPRDGQAVCVDLILGRHEHTFGLRLGGTLPLHVGAAGKAALAWSGAQAIDAYLADRRLLALTERTLLDAVAIRAELGRSVRQGFTISDQDVITGAAAIGAPLFDHTGGVVGGISVSGLRHQILGEARDGLVDAVTATAARISESLGASSEAATA